MDWTAWLRELLCRLYMAWGGQCDELGKTPSNWVNTVVGVYATKGAPTFPDQNAKERFLTTLDLLEVHLAQPGNTLTPAENAELAAWIADLRADLGTL